ncbi:hypothetical protein ACFL6I_00435 [candidate division KSB1 bacterium]
MSGFEKRLEGVLDGFFGFFHSIPPPLYRQLSCSEKLAPVTTGRR